MNKSQEKVICESILEEFNSIDFPDNVKNCSRQNLKQTSPFGRIFSESIKWDCCNIPSNEEENAEDNPFYSPMVFKAVTDVVHLIPLWSVFCVHWAVDNGLQIESLKRLNFTNGRIENHFKTVKHGLLTGRKRLTPRKVVCSLYGYVAGKLNEQLLPSVSRKRKNCDLLDEREKWSKRKKPKPSYSNRSVIDNTFSRIDKRVASNVTRYNKGESETKSQKDSSKHIESDQVN